MFSTSATEVFPSRQNTPQNVVINHIGDDGPGLIADLDKG
jgi:hypothetical protein